MENYTPRHNDYSPLRDIHEDQPAREAEATVEEQASVQNEASIQTQTPEPEPEPLRPEGRYGGYAQGDGDYVSESMAAVYNDTQVVNRDYYASMAADQAASRDRSQEAVEQDLNQQAAQEGPEVAEGQEATAARNPEVSEFAQDYAAAHPDSGATDEELYNAAYFAHSVDDSEKYPPRNDEEKNLVEERQSYEATDRVLAERSGEEIDMSAEQEQAQMEDRMQASVSYQHRMSMSMSM